MKHMRDKEQTPTKRCLGRRAEVGDVAETTGDGNVKHMRDKEQTPTKRCLGRRAEVGDVAETTGAGNVHHMRDKEQTPTKRCLGRRAEVGDVAETTGAVWHPPPPLDILAPCPHLLCQTDPASQVCNHFNGQRSCLCRRLCC